VTAPFYYRITEGIRVTVRPMYLPEQSEPVRGRFVFAYHIRLENVSDRAAQLLTRHWLIHDDAGPDSQVDGEGVVGMQPLLVPGGVHQYQSFCVLHGQTGWMEGRYGFVRDDGTPFDVVIPRFELAVTTAGPGER
jgi:ApaG protein